MLYLIKLRLINFCNYEDVTLDFTRPDGTPYPFVCFFGPNGIGKSTLLEAISILTMNSTGRKDDYITESLRKYVRNPDYDPAYEGIKGRTYDKSMIAGMAEARLPDMAIEGTYRLDGKEYVVRLTQNGYTRNDFAPIPPANCEPEEAYTIMAKGPWGEDHLLFRQRIAHHVGADNDLSMSKFQLHYAQMNNFEEIISLITRYKSDCVVPTGISIHDRGYCTDFCITKRNRRGQEHRVHYKRMSAGERKICTSFAQTLNLIHDLETPEPGEVKMEGWPRLLLIDNVEMHVYYDRHVTMIQCLKNVFNKQQIFATTHSGVLIPRFLNGEHDPTSELWVDLEKLNG